MPSVLKQEMKQPEKGIKNSTIFMTHYVLSDFL